jgi:hypothetical protein
MEIHTNLGVDDNNNIYTIINKLNNFNFTLEKNHELNMMMYCKNTKL